MSDEDIRELVRELDSLHDGDRAMVKLMSIGDRAIPFVRDFLLSGEPDAIFRPRQRAVEVLGALGAKDALIEYLLRPIAIENPAVAYGESAVEITAARELKRWRTDDVFDALLRVLQRRIQPGAIETIGEFRRAEALPFLIRALGDSISGGEAADALRKYGASAREALLDAAEHAPNPREREAARRVLNGMQKFYSILFPGDALHEEEHDAPEFFRDLNLDQIVSSIAIRWPQYRLAPFFYQRLATLEEIAYRHEVFRDLEHDPIMRTFGAFADQMRDVRKHLDRFTKLYFKYEKERWFLSAAETYCAAIQTLRRDLADTEINARGLQMFREYLVEYESSDSFQRLVRESRDVASQLAAIRYSLLIDGDAITVRDYAGERDASAAVEETFAKFRTAEAKDHRVRLKDTEGIDHVEAWVLERVAWLHPDVFAALDTFCAAHKTFIDDTIARFDREVHFYIGYLGYITELRAKGLSFCYPEISQASKEVCGESAFDLALARKLLDDPHPKAVVTNDFCLLGEERIVVVSGPNQGGKTTFARMFGQMHYLGAIGCLVPGTRSRLYLFDRIFTHFEKEEDVANLRGKLQDDLVRMRYILDRATSNSIVIINEIFSSTTIGDALELGRRVFEKLSSLDLIAVCVTFLDELSRFNRKTISVVSMVDPRDPAVRTFKLERRPADGRAYAMALAQKYGLTRRQMEERIGS